MRAPWQVALVLVIASAALSACWTSASDGEALRARVRLIEEGQASQREGLQGEIANAQTKMAELEEVLGQAATIVQRASADTGAQVDQIHQQVMALEGQLAELRNEVSRQQTQSTENSQEVERQLKKIAQHVGLDTAVDESEVPADADGHWALAEQTYEQRQFGRARTLYRLFGERHGADDRVDNAQFRIGVSYLEENRPATALGELNNVRTNHPQGDVADDALLAMANAFYALHACGDARATLQALIRTHASSPLLPRARARLREIQRAPRSYCTR